MIVAATSNYMTIKFVVILRRCWYFHYTWTYKNEEKAAGILIIAMPARRSF